MRGKPVYFLLLIMGMSLLGCSLVSSIFKAGAWTGLVIALVVIAVAAALILALRKK